MKELKNQFMQGAFLTTVWLMGILTLGFGNPTVSLSYFWHIIGIGVIAGGVFGFIYPYLWNYSTWTAPVNIIVSSIINSIAGYTAVYLFSPEMFVFILPFWWGVLALTVVLHTIAFYFYRNHQNKQLVKELNQQVK